MIELIELLNNGWDIKFTPAVKRINGEWKIRFCWKAERNEESYESEWEGFENPEDCTKNAYDTLIPVKQPEEDEDTLIYSTLTNSIDSFFDAFKPK